MGIKWYHIVIFTGAVIGLAVLLLPGEREWGLQLEEGGYMDRSEEHLVKALEENPRDKQLLRRLSSIYLRTERPGKAIPLFKRLLRVVQDTTPVREQLIDLHIQVGNLERAIALLRKSEMSSEDRRRLVGLYEQTGETSEAINVVKALLDKNPKDLGLLQRWAKLERWRTNPSGEAKALRALAEVRAESDSLRRLMQLELSQGDMQGALWAADRLAEMAELGLEQLRSLRTIYTRARKLKPALAAAKRICELPQHGPEDVKTFAQLQQAAGQKVAALSTLRKGLKDFPEQLVLLRPATALARESGKDEIAAELSTKLAENTGQESDRMQAARAHVKIGQVDRARRLLHGLVESGKNLSPRTIWYAATLDLEADDQVEAVDLTEKLATRARANPEDPLPARLAADLFNRVSKLEGQLEMLELAARAAPEQPTVLRDLAVVYSDAGRHKEALVVLERLAKLPDADMELIRREKARNLLAMTRQAEEGPERRTQLRERAMRAIEASLRDGQYPELRAAQVGFYAASGEYEKARAAMNELKGVSPEVWLGLAGQFADREKSVLVRQALGHIEDTSGFNARQLDILAYAYRKAGNIDRAITYYERAVAKAPDNKQILLHLANAYGAAEKFQKEYEIVEDIARGGTVDDWIAAANRHLWHGDRKGEALVLAQALKEHPEAPGLLKRRLQALVALERYEEAMKVYDRMQLAGAQPDVDTLIALADAHVRLGNDGRAAGIYRKVLARQPKQQQALFGLAQVRSRAGDYEDAVGLYRRYLKVAPEDGAAWFELGEALYEAGKDGSHAHKRALALLTGKGTLQALATRARIRTRQSQFDRAAELYAEALEARPDDADLAADYVSLLLQADRLDYAERVLDEAMAKSTRNQRLRRLRASLLLRKDMPERALGLLKEVQAESPRDVELLRDIASTYIDLGRYTQARATLDKLDDLGANMSWIRRERARAALTELRQLAPEDPRRDEVAEKAVSAIEASLKEEPDPDLSRSLAELYLELDRSGEALKRARQVQEVPPWFSVDLAGRFVEKGRPGRARQALALLPPRRDLKPATLVAVGSIRQQLGQQEKAVEVYRLAVEKDPDYDQAVVSLADAYGQIGEVERQYALMKRRAMDGRPEEWLDAADRHLWHDDYEGEAEVLEEALQQFPDSPKLLARGVQSFGELAQYDRALKLYDRLRELGKGEDASTLAVVAQAQVSAGRRDDAERTFKRALQKDPLNRQALLGLAELKSGKRQYRAAAELYKSYLTERPNAGWVWFQLGEVVYEAGGNGSSAHDRALELVRSTDEPASLAMRARIHARRKEWGAAIERYEEALATAGSDVDLACDFVDVLLSAGRAERAERLLEATANQDPKNLRVRRQKAALLMRYSQYEQAAVILRQLHRRRPEDVSIERELALAERMSGRWAAGMQHYDSASRRAGSSKRPMPAAELDLARDSTL